MSNHFERRLLQSYHDRLQARIRLLEQDNARLLALVERHADPEGKTPSAIHAAMMSMELALGNSQETVYFFDATKQEWEVSELQD